MKLKAILTIAMIALVGLTAGAQRKKATTARASTSGKWAVIEIPQALELLEQDDKNLYFKCEFNDLSVYAINKTTGDVTRVIKYAKNYDDDAPDMQVKALGSVNDTLYVATTGARVYEYNGSDLNTSKKVLEVPKRAEHFVRFAFSPDGKQMAMRGVSYSGNAYVAQMKRDGYKGVRGYAGNNSFRILIDHKNRLWTQSLEGVDIVTERSTEAKKAAEYTTDNGALGTNGRYLGEHAMCFVPADTTVLVAVGRKIYATPDTVVNWREVAKFPSDCPAQSVEILLSNGKQTYAITNDVNARIVCWENGLDNPATVMQQIETDIAPESIYAGKFVSTNTMPDQHMAHLDKDGNLYLYANGKIWIYNPTGIKGFASRKGKLTKIELARNN